MTTLITGINGAAGSYLKEALEEKGETVTGISRDECDMRNSQNVLDKLDSTRPDIIYHLAADASVDESYAKPNEYMINNTTSTINLFEALRKLKLNPMIMVASSSEVYGIHHGTIEESAPLNPTNPYGASTAAKDLLAQMYARHYGFHVIITRGFSYINPRRPDLSLTHFAHQIASIESGQLQTLEHGNLNATRAFLDVRDVIRSFLTVPTLPPISNKHHTDGIYNIANENPTTIRNCLEILISLANTKIHTSTNPSHHRITDTPTVIANTYHFRSTSHCHPIYPLHDSLNWLLDSVRNMHKP